MAVMTHPTSRATADLPAVEAMDGPAAVRAVDAFRLVYAEAFAEPPYRETEADIALTFDRFHAEAAHPGFRATLARTAAGEPLGMALGTSLGRRSGWWDPYVAPADRPRTFCLLELAVRTAHRRHGLARRLHDALLQTTDADRILLTVHLAATPARAAYRSWGYRTIAEVDPWGNGVHAVMLLDRAATGGDQ
ncbi:GNAT family N-acetyltransferase [Streptomyces mobaraensis]|uniref:GNAT family N-acetyltransferase n=2 Tax=Streptomyces mobaraensis TaxID=35621 RepID=A0A5N5WDV6_STRMB|nr:GNAT family N-acetyltransferase [Streptomyces mobaraensis]KAB7849917.1 GNAT family N-acetyltransferase [Streptomyces mobaraensis]